MLFQVHWFNPLTPMTPELDAIFGPLIRDICSIGYVKSKSEMRKRVLGFAKEFARSVVPEEDTGPTEEWAAGHEYCRTQTLDNITKAE